MNLSIDVEGGFQSFAATARRHGSFNESGHSDSVETGKCPAPLQGSYIAQAADVVRISNTAAVRQTQSTLQHPPGTTSPATPVVEPRPGLHHDWNGPTSLGQARIIERTSK